METLLHIVYVYCVIQWCPGSRVWDQSSCITYFPGISGTAKQVYSGAENFTWCVGAHLRLQKPPASMGLAGHLHAVQVPLH